MKAITLILAVACTVSLSSCCCQSQPMPKLRPMPKFQPTDACLPNAGAPADATEPVHVMQSGKGSK